MKRRVSRRHHPHPKKRPFPFVTAFAAAAAVLVLIVIAIWKRERPPQIGVVPVPPQMRGVEPSGPVPTARRVAPPEGAQPAARPSLEPPVFVAAPDPRCHNLGRLNASLYRCGETLILLKEGAAFPEDLKSAPWQRALTELRNRGLVEGALTTDKGDISLSAVPNDAQFAGQMFLHGDAPYAIGAPDAWSAGTGSPGVIVAIIDSGVDLVHPDLADNLWTNAGEIASNGTDDDGNGYIDDVHGYNFNAATADIQDDQGHGTHGAGVIGAVGNNGIGVAGVNWDVGLMALKFTDDTGKGSLAAAVEAINYAIAHDAKVINASWVMDLSTPEKVSLLQSAVQGANNAGLVLVAAAGNGFAPNPVKDIDATPLYPAALDLPGVISVAAVDPDMALSSFSNFGATTVDLGAPGSGILSTALEGGYSQSAGTSVAASVVSGAAALLLAQKPALTPLEVKAALLNSVKTDAQLFGKVASGGTLNLSNALASLGVTLVPSDKATKMDTVLEASSSSNGGSGKSGGCSLIQ